jgi:hypothetical protein
MKFLVLIYVLFTSAVFGQEAADYYDRPIHELQEKLWVQDTVLSHTGGFPQCYHEMQDWARKNKANLQFKSITSVDSSGVVQLIIRSDCRDLRSKGPVLEYYMTMTAKTDSVRIEFWNINPKSKDCGALFRRSLKKEIAEFIATFMDSAKYVHVPYKGFGDPQSKPERKTDRITRTDHFTDSIFGIVRTDSIAQQRAKDSIASIPVEADVEPDEPDKNIAAAQMAADSVAAIVEKDSAALRPIEVSIFKGQLSCRGKIDVAARIECLQFLISHKLRSAPDVLRYLTSLQKYCNDKCEMIRTARATLPDEDKFRAVGAYRHAQDDCTKVQGLSERITLSKEEYGSLNSK